MTDLVKTVQRVDRRNNLVLELTPEGLVVRELGRRLKYGPLSYKRLWQLGAQMKADELRREKALTRAARKAARRGA